MKKQFLSRILFLLVVFSCLTSCQKDARDQLAAPTQSHTNAKLADLLERASREGTPEEYAAITAEYKKLTFEELEEFSLLKSRQDSARLGGSAGARVDMSIVYQQVKTGRELKTAMNRQSLQLYGIPYNHLTFEQLNAILRKMSQEDDRYSVLKNSANTDPNARTTGCPSRYFPYSCTNNYGGGPKWNDWANKSTPDSPNDCDFEYRWYNGYKNHVSPGDWFNDQLLQSFGNRVLTTYDSPAATTFILLGSARVYFWIGSPYIVNVRMNYI